MAGKTQFTEHWTVNLTPEQEEAAHTLRKRLGHGSKQSLLEALLMTACTDEHIPWPNVEKLPVGRRGAARDKGKFIKP